MAVSIIDQFKKGERLFFLDCAVKDMRLNPAPTGVHDFVILSVRCGRHIVEVKCSAFGEAQRLDENDKVVTFKAVNTIRYGS